MPTVNRVRPWCLLAMCLALAGTAVGRDKTDVLIMKNGDRITCEVKRLEGEILQVGLDYVDGTVSIDWQKVARLESTYLFLVQLTDGSIFSGQVVTPEALGNTPRSLEIREPGSEVPVSINQRELVSMTQTSVSWTERFNGGVTLGSQYAKGNDTTQYNFSSDVGYEETLWAAKASYTSSLSSSTGAETKTRNQLDLNGFHMARRKTWFYAGAAGYLQSSVQGIESQVGVGGGLGKFLKNTGTTRITLMGGAGWQTTRYVPDQQNQRVQNLAVATIVSSADIFQFKKTRLSATASVAPALTELGRVFARTNVAYYLKLFGKFDWNMSFYGSWDNRPPTGLQSSDYGTSTGLSYTFGNR